MGYKVLMVDDEPLVLAGYKRILGRYFDIQTAAGAKKGLQLLRKAGPFAVVVVDYMMPEMDGIEFSIEARQLAPQTLRIMLTGKGGLEVAAEALNKGNIFYYLDKPCSKESLLGALIAAIEKYRVPDTVSSVVNPERLAGLIYFYRALFLWESNKLKLAVSQFNKSAALFDENDLSADAARAKLFLAGALLQDRQSIDAGHDLYNTEPVDALSKALSFYNDKEPAPTFPAEEQKLIKPALKWALDNNITPGAAKKLIISMGDPEPAGSRLQLRVLGPFHISLKDRELEEKQWRNPKIKMLFLYLLTHRNIKIDRHMILEEFWPEMDPRSAGNNLSSCLYFLRQLFGSSLLAYKKGLCWLEPEEYWCDADAFEGAVKKGKSLYHEGEDRAAARCFETALSLYRGDYLEEYLYEDWAAEERSRLRSLYLETLALYGAILAGQKKFSEAAEVLERAQLAALHDYDLLYDLINYYMLAGKEGRALERFKYYSALMRDELGLEPAPKVVSLIEQIRGC